MSHLIDGHLVVGRNVLNSTLGHLPVLRIVWTLHHRDAAPALDLPQPHRAVVQHSRENHADYAWAVRESCGTKKRIDGRSRSIFSWARAEMDVAMSDEHVAIRRSDVHAARLDLFAIECVLDVQRCSPLQNAGQKALFVRTEVLYHEYRSLQLRVQSGEQTFQSLDATRRSADHDDVVCTHGCTQNLSST